MNTLKLITRRIDAKKINISLGLFIVFSIFMYLYSYQTAVLHASTIENMEDKISNLKSEISEVEFQIVESKRQLNKNVALSDGFIPIDEVVFIKKMPKTALNAVTN